MPRLLSLTLLATTLAAFALADDPEPTTKAKSRPTNPGLSAVKPPTHKVEKAPFKVEVTLKGVFESAALAEVSIKPEVWGPAAGGGLTVVKAAEPGTAVKTGDVLLTLDREKIDRAVRDQEADQQLADLAIRLAELDLPIVERSAPLELAAADRGKARADEDLRKFLAVDKPLMVESAEFGVRNAAHNLEYVEEELKQLQKMYRKDLTEETEEIILKRQRNQVESAKFMLKQAENRRDQTLKVDLPRREQDMKDAAVKAGIADEKVRSTTPLAVNQKRLALEKAKYERARGAEKLANLKKDRELFVVKSPADGIVYYGRSVQGQWPAAAGLVTRLQKGGSIQSDEVFMTIVKPGPLTVRATVEEKDRGLVAAGAPCKVTPAAMPDTKLAGKIDRVSRVPVGGTFEAIVGFDSAPGDAIVPGMACAVKVVTYTNPDAVTVPAVAVFDDELDEDKHYVYKAGTGKPEKATVTVGKRSGGRAEITSGLSAGDEILLAKP
jgi:multidrug efflux pump subunit AcrA (membrane-fusion protein)